MRVKSEPVIRKACQLFLPPLQLDLWTGVPLCERRAGRNSWAELQLVETQVAWGQRSKAHQVSGWRVPEMGRLVGRDSWAWLTYSDSRAEKRLNEAGMVPSRELRERLLFERRKGVSKKRASEALCGAIESKTGKIRATGCLAWRGARPHQVGWNCVQGSEG